MGATITATDDDDDDNAVVTVSGTATWDHDGDEQTAVISVPKASLPATTTLIIIDDDEASGAPRNLAVAPTAEASDAFNYTATWVAPARPGQTDGTAILATAITYEVRVERSSVIGDAAWDVTTGITVDVDNTSGAGTATIDLVQAIGPVTADNWRSRSYKVQVRVTGDDNTIREKEFTTPAAGS